MSKYKGFDLYDRDDELETKEGVDLRFPNKSVITILRAGGSNDKFNRAFSRITKPFQRQLQAGQLDKDTSDKLYAEVYAESVIVGWDGIETPDGEPVPFNKKNVIEFLIAMPEVFVEIRVRADNIETFRRAEIAAEVENLGNV